MTRNVIENRKARRVAAEFNKRMKLTATLASPHGTRRRGSACSPFGEHRAPAAYPWC
jgi:hypothetical protein